jgi:formamidopyrimidine-DNA glycosylase
VPELPEVETVVRGLHSSVIGYKVEEIVFFRDSLRDEIPVTDLREVFVGRVIIDVFRRSKYIILATDRGTGFIHLGMSGNFLLQRTAAPLLPHTHVIFRLSNAADHEIFLHFVDPRRFGRIACQIGPDWQAHQLMQRLGVEPLETADLGKVLYNKGRARQVVIKAHIMDAQIVVGVGNIYASESLFAAGINPDTKTSQLSARDYQHLGLAIQNTLKNAIAAGGTTLKDYRNLEGKSGYFAISLNVYGRHGAPCLTCGTIISLFKHSGRSTYFCSFCQKAKKL